MTTLSGLLRRARARLRDAGVETPELDAGLLVEHFTGAGRAEVISDPERVVPDETAAAVDAAVARRAAGEPVHRILGFREFYGLRLSLSPETLEPRPDTETLVDLVLPWLREKAAAGIRPRILDLGTGTGAIALALLREVPQATALGIDVSADAVATARRNAAALGLADRFEARRSDWFSAVAEKFHAIVSNPPYIASRLIATLSREVRDFDPVRALDGGDDGLDPYRIIAARSRGHLEHGGRVAVEIGHDQEKAVAGLFDTAGFQPVGRANDLLGHVRSLMFSRLCAGGNEQTAWQGG